MGAVPTEKLQAAMAEAAAKYDLPVHDEAIGAAINDFTRQQLVGWQAYCFHMFNISGANMLGTMIAQAVGMLDSLDRPASIEFLEALLDCRRSLLAGDRSNEHAQSVRLNDAIVRLGLAEAALRMSEEDKS